MRFAIQFKGHDNNGRSTEERWTRLVLELDPATNGLSIVAHWKGYDSLLKCADVADDLGKLCVWMHKVATNPEYLPPHSVDSKYCYRIAYA